MNSRLLVVAACVALYGCDKPSHGSQVASAFAKGESRVSVESQLRDRGITYKFANPNVNLDGVPLAIVKEEALREPRIMFFVPEGRPDEYDKLTRVIVVFDSEMKVSRVMVEDVSHGF